MAKKERNRRSARKARAEERAQREAAQVATNSQAAAVKETRSEAKAQTPKQTKKDAKPGFFARIGNYFSAVKSEMHRVTWPSKQELKDYSIGVIVMLIVFGISIWVIDNLAVIALTAFAGLRG